MPPKKTAQRQKNNPLHKKSNDRVAQFITGIFGSIAFLLIFMSLLIGWMIWNLGMIKSLAPIDPYPFDKLELFLSSFAIFLSIAVLISQKRQARLEKLAQQVEFEVNLSAEKEITKVLEMLQGIQNKLGIKQDDPELKRMMEDLDTEKIHQAQQKAEENDN